MARRRVTWRQNWPALRAPAGLSTRRAVSVAAGLVQYRAFCVCGSGGALHQGACGVAEAARYLGACPA